MKSSLLAFRAIRACFGLACVVNVALAVDGQSAADNATTPQINPVVEWNRTMLTILRMPGVQPASIHPTRNLAMLHLAIDDAVSDVRRQFPSWVVSLPLYQEQSLELAAVDQAAHDVLLSLYPTQSTMLDALLQVDLARIPDGPRKSTGIQIGGVSANKVLRTRKNDGSDAIQPVYVSTGKPGDYQLTPPNMSPADFTQWPKVRPFSIVVPDEFRPGPPPALTSREYTDSFNEVKSLGLINSTTRTTEQTQIGNFWNGNIQDFWNEIAQTASLQQQLDIAQTARLFALVNISMADTTIALFDAKYVYRLWRPVTAIQLADTDGNPNTSPDPNWIPLPTKTAPDPSYAGAHSAISEAAAETLILFLGDRFTFDVTSETLTGITRHFTQFSDAAEEAGLSRIFAGQHFRFDHVAGKSLGKKIAEVVVATHFFPGQ